MTDDHTFVDSGGAAISGREAMLAGWRQCFALFPDYGSLWVRSCRAEPLSPCLARGPGLTLENTELCRRTRWNGPAAWKVLVEGGRIKTWQVFADHTKTSDVVKRSQE